MISEKGWAFEEVTIGLIALIMGIIEIIPFFINNNNQKNAVFLEDNSRNKHYLLLKKSRWNVHFAKKILKPKQMKVILLNIEQ